MILPWVVQISLQKQEEQLHGYTRNWVFLTTCLSGMKVDEESGKKEILHNSIGTVI